MGKISVVINTLNEQENLPRALASVRNLADEIVVCDMDSDDRTQEVAKRMGAKIYEYKRTGYVEPARNFALRKAQGEHILILDADEEVPASLAKKLKKLAEKPEADFYRLPRKNIIFAKWIRHSRWWPDYNIRFFKKGAVTWSEIIHSVPETHGTGLDLEPTEDNAIVHYHYVSIDQYIERHNRYSTEYARLLIKDGYKFSWKDLIIKPINEFLSRYFFGQGYKDGIHGLALTLLQAFTETVIYLKVWQAEKFKDQKADVRDVISAMKEVESDIHYWQADTLFKEGGGMVQRVKRKFKLP